MATTAAAVLMTKERPSVAHVGDSRVYLWRDGRLSQITEDHSWVGEQVRAGVLSDADARRHPWRNVVTRALSGGEDPEVDVTEVSPKPAERYLLCSDGLFGVVPDAQIAEILGEQIPLDAICQRLVSAANEAGGPDNITVSPHGGLILAEDGEGINHLVGVTRRGRAYPLARNDNDENGEFCGPSFSLDGRVLFTNIQSKVFGATLAITGPWHRG